MESTARWLRWDFGVFSKEGDWPAKPGLYVFAGFWSGQWYPQYLGQTGSFDTRLPTHEKWSESVQLGATHVHVKIVHTKHERDAIEAELIQAYKPPLNKQHNPGQ